MAARAGQDRPPVSAIAIEAALKSEGREPSSRSLCSPLGAGIMLRSGALSRVAVASCSLRSAASWQRMQNGAMERPPALRADILLAVAHTPKVPSFYGAGRRGTLRIRWIRGRGCESRIRVRPRE